MTQPVKVFRMGYVKCEVFSRHARTGPQYHAIITRLFKNGTQWCESRQFSKDELMLVAKLADAAHSWMYDAHREADDDAATPSMPQEKL